MIMQVMGLVGTQPAVTLRLAILSVADRGYASADEFGRCQDIWRELRAGYVRFAK